MTAARICSERECPRVATDRGRCPQHAEESRVRKIKLMDETRDNSARRGYDARHRQWRQRILERDPTCKWPGCAEPSVVADHIRRIVDGGSRFRMENGQGMCEYHHNVKRQEESHAAKRRKSKKD